MIISKLDHRQIGYQISDWNILAQDRVQLGGFVNKLMNFVCHESVAYEDYLENSLVSRQTVINLPSL
jgi:hypothetical protein